MAAESLAGIGPHRVVSLGLLGRKVLTPTSGTLLDVYQV